MSSGVRKDRNKVGHGFKEPPRKNEPPRLQGVHEQQYHGGIYWGEYEEGKRHGKGSMKYDNGEIYEGGWCAGKPQGVCVYIWPDGMAFEGEWHIKMVVNGIEMPARGYKESEDEPRHQHRFKEGLYTGELSIVKNEVYLKHGLGSMIFDSGARYVGQWRLDIQHGKGTYVWPSGTRYEGEFCDNKIKGRGTTIWFDGGVSTKGMPPLMLCKSPTDKPKPVRFKPERRKFEECSSEGKLCLDCRQGNVKAGMN